MTQFARPIADLFVDSLWEKVGGAGDFYTLVDEAVADDGDYAHVPFSHGGTTNVLVFQLATLDGPANNDEHVLTVRFADNTFTGTTLAFELRQGYVDESTKGTLIASQSALDLGGTNAFTDYDLALSSGEAAAISDYSDLAVRIVAVQGNNFDESLVSQTWLEAADAPVEQHLTLTTATGTFDLTGVSLSFQLALQFALVAAAFIWTGFPAIGSSSAAGPTENRPLVVRGTVDGQLTGGMFLGLNEDGDPLVAINLRWYGGNLRWSRVVAMPDAQVVEPL